MDLPHRDVLRRPLLVALVVLLISACLPLKALAQEGPESSAAPDDTTWRVYLPLIMVRWNESAAFTLDNVPITINSPFLPGEFSTSAPGDTSQIAAAFDISGLREISLIILRGRLALLRRRPARGGPPQWPPVGRRQRLRVPVCGCLRMIF